MGATGQTGRSAIKYAIKRGLKVRALVRNPAAAETFPQPTEVVLGDATDSSSLATLIEGSDAVISALGPRDLTTGFVVCSTAAKLLAQEMPKVGLSRYVAVSGASLAVEGDGFGLRGKFFRTAALFLAKTNNDINRLLQDKQREYDNLRQSKLDWTLVRPAWIVPGELQVPAKITTNNLGGSRVRVEELAATLVELAIGMKFNRQAVFVHSEQKG